MDTIQQGEIMKIFSSIRLLFTALALSFSCASFAGFSISNGQLVDNNGTPFVMRGMAYPFAWYTQRYPAQTQQDIANMSATGANTVRFVLGTGAQFPRNSGAQVAQIVQWAKDNRMIAVLEVHDSTGWSESAPAAPITNAVAYWTSSDIRAAINGQENFVIINIANEPFGNNTTANFTPNTIAAIQSLRSAGLTHTLMVDAANWGQDWSNTMRSNAMQIWNADTRRNLVFSVHMYEVYAQASAVVSYMQAFDDMNLPLVIGEFGADHQGQPVDEGTIMAQAQQRGNGYIGWSWSGNGGCCVSLDIVSNFGTALTSWGQILVNGANGIRATSVRASVFQPVGNNLTVAPATLSLASAASSAAVQVTSNVSWSVTDNATWISVAPASGTNNGSFTVSATANTGAARSGTVTVTGGGISRSIALTQAAAQGGGNNLVVSATSVSLGAGASSSGVNVTSNVSWTVTDDQAWLTPSPASGSNNATLTLNATANTGAAARTGTVTVTGGGIVRSIAVTQAGSVSTPGSVTATGAVTSSSGWFTEEQVRLSNTATITALTVTITVQRTAGVNGSGQYNSIGGTVTQSMSSTATQVVYTYTLNSGQTISPGSGRAFAAQMSGNGTAHPTAGDSWTVTGTAGGSAINLSGTF
jgi:mannan endo-1,4-beta-mannosidase